MVPTESLSPHLVVYSLPYCFLSLRFLKDLRPSNLGLFLEESKVWIFPPMFESFSEVFKPQDETLFSIVIAIWRFDILAELIITVLRAILSAVAILYFDLSELKG